jgi:hypothetical protein
VGEAEAQAFLEEAESVTAPPAPTPAAVPKVEEEDDLDFD